MQPITPTPWLYDYKSRPSATLRLICFPFLGGSPDAFKPLAEMLPEVIHVVGVVYPGRAKRFADPLITNLDEFLRVVTEALLPTLKTSPRFAFFGYSMGCMLMTELALYLKATHGIQPVALVAAAQNPRFIRDDDPVLHLLPTDKELLEELAKEGGMPPEVLEYPELQELMVPIYRADSQLSYIPEERRALWEAEIAQGTQERVDSAIFAYGGIKERRLTKETLGRWRDLSTNAKFQVRQFDGDHFFIKTALPMLAQMLARDLLTLQ